MAVPWTAPRPRPLGAPVPRPIPWELLPLVVTVLLLAVPLLAS
ncbi:hypothetical protein [Streptomyces sp. SID5473]|nr:hypothetical protein [Streptomyces sp. SID5473]